MSDFDAMDQMQFAEVARTRHGEGRPLPVTVIDPNQSTASMEKFRRVFREVEFEKNQHQYVDWGDY